MLRQVVLDQIVPVPVGHLVRIHELELRRGGGWLPAPHDALVVDLDTGIEYVPARLFSTAGASNSFYDATLFKDRLDAEHARIATTWTGRVVACRIATDASRDHGYATRLLIEPAR